MAEYIERRIASNKLYDVYEYVKRNIIADGKPVDASLVKNIMLRFEKALNMAPNADVAAVRHGRWMFGKDLPENWGQLFKNRYHLYCSECKEQAHNKSEDNNPDFDIDTPYCPWCGAIMDLEG